MNKNHFILIIALIILVAAAVVYFFISDSNTLTNKEKTVKGASKLAISGKSMPKKEQTGNRIALAEQAPVPATPPGESVKDKSAVVMRDEEFNTEEYDAIYENEFMDPVANPLSTFSIDVDTASYSNMRRFLKSGQLPPGDAVRIEELINYFRYDYPEPEKEHPLSITTEVAACPWNLKHKLVHIGLKGKSISRKNIPPSNLVFLLDVSGSMNSPNKLPLLKQAFKLLVQQLREEDRVAIVVYAGAAGVVLPSTSGDEKEKIMDALDGLEAGGSTAGGEGIILAYEIAKKNFIEDGNNRIILATDGDFNVGVSSDAGLVRLIEEKRKSGIYLSILGFGMGNYKDSKMEKLADRGNGNYAYIDSLLEAKKVLVSEMGATLLTIAKDVKIQVEFNPAHVNAYRLIGYENRLLAAEDFNDDTKDAGELGSGHTVTALYEIVPAGVEIKLRKTDPLKYRKKPAIEESSFSNELLTVKFRYKPPKEEKSKLIIAPLKDSDVKYDDASDNYKFSAAVAGFGMLLRDSKFKGSMKFDTVLELADDAKGDDENGYREEFLELVKIAKKLSKKPI